MQILVQFSIIFQLLMKDAITQKHQLSQPFNFSQNSTQSIKETQLQYQAQPNVQGECMLSKVIPIRRCGWRSMIYYIFSLLLIGMPALLAYWQKKNNFRYPKLRMKWYYLEVAVEQATHFYVLNNDGQITYPKKKQTHYQFNQEQVRLVNYFQNRYLKYIIENSTVKAANFDFFPHLKQAINNKVQGLRETQAKLLQQSYGPGSMILEQKGFLDLFATQVMRPLYFFIVMSCILWSIQQYWSYGILILVTALGGILTNLIQTYKLNKKIHQMAYYQTQVNILRDGTIFNLSSRAVVPGDVVFIKDAMKMPFDGILLHGTVLMNQCSITGQSVPILKKAQDFKKITEIKQSYLYESSLLLQTNCKNKFKESLEHLQKFREKYGLPVYVIRTNFTTAKGQLIRIISFPTQRQNIFQKQSVKFLLFLFVLTVTSYVILVIKLAEYADPFDLVIKFLDLITVTVPPGLPVSMTFGIIFAIEKMKKKKIFCISPNKTIVGGMVDFLCFDKTGTLTEDFMDFYALIPVQYQPTQFHTPILNTPQSLFTTNQTHSLQFALTNMATNHTIVKLNSTNQNVGDPMEVKMFEFGGYYLKDQGDCKADVLEEYGCHRGEFGQIFGRFQFDSELFRMSTISKGSQSGDDYYLYAKGSPQQMLNVFNPDTVPHNYYQILKRYTCQGFRVLAIGHRNLGQVFNSLPARSAVEQNLIFDGFQIFQNRLKKQTCPAIQELQSADIPCVMITGDHALTAASIGFECKILNGECPAYICGFDSEKNQLSLEKFHGYKGEEEEKDVFVKMKGIQEIIEFANKEHIEIVMTGQAFNFMFVDAKQLTQTQKELLLTVKIFSRAKPKDKSKIIELFQLLSKTVGMCGDGANDCSALKQADIGLSLSEAQASISAPFTSQVTNISSMIELLKECRAGLATNYSLFNIMALYSIIQYNTVLIVQFYYGYPADFHYLYWDTFCNFVFFLTFGYTGTTSKLTKEGPNCSLFTVSNITQLLIAFIIQMIGQFGMIMLLNIWDDPIGYRSDITYSQFIQNGQQFVTDSYENNILFMFTNFMYIFTLLAFSVSKPWRKEFYTNFPFVIVLTLVLAFSSAIIIFPYFRIDYMELSRFSDEGLLIAVLAGSWGFGGVIYFVQKFLLEPWFNKIELKRKKAERLVAMK